MTILLVEDHKPTRDEIRALVEQQPDLRVIGEAVTGEDAITLTRELRPDTIIMDILLPGINGVETTRAICAEHPGIKVVALSNHFGSSLVQAILDAGGRGYVRKSRAFEDLVIALRAIANGTQYVDRKFAPRKAGGVPSPQS